MCCNIMGLLYGTYDEIIIIIFLKIKKVWFFEKIHEISISGLRYVVKNIGIIKYIYFYLGKWKCEVFWIKILLKLFK